MSNTRPKLKPTSQRDGFTTFSIRLNDHQRDLLLQAASLKGWTPTQLVRTATIEKVAGICNTLMPRSFDYKGLAAELARGWFAPPDASYSLTASDWQVLEDPNPDADRALCVPVPPLPLETARRLRKAAEEGGTEFLSLLVEFAEGLTAAQRSDLPAPIDPKTLIGRED